ncbi:MAG TPA: DNA-3-methyladenine glycosylase, partial [Pirellulaceae bacterium]
QDPCLSRTVRRWPGLRVPGTLDGFELAVRAILGQQISVRGAVTLAGRLAIAYGSSVETPRPELHLLWPTPERLAATKPSSLKRIGLRTMTAKGIQSLATAVLDQRITLEPGRDPVSMLPALESLPGIGPWTAQYIALRALRWPDAFPWGDLGLLKATRLSSSRELRKASEAWRPWRSYAAMYLWESLR